MVHADVSMTILLEQDYVQLITPPGYRPAIVAPTTSVNSQDSAYAGWCT